MAITNHERVGKALDLLKVGLGPFVEREVKGAIESRKLDAHQLHGYGEDRVLGNKSIPERDVAGAAQADVGNLARCLSRDSGTGGAESGQRVARPPQPVGTPGKFLER